MDRDYELEEIRTQRGYGLQMALVAARLAGATHDEIAAALAENPHVP